MCGPLNQNLKHNLKACNARIFCMGEDVSRSVRISPVFRLWLAQVQVPRRTSLKAPAEESSAAHHESSDNLPPLGAGL